MYTIGNELYRKQISKWWNYDIMIDSIRFETTNFRFHRQSESFETSLIVVFVIRSSVDTSYYYCLDSSLSAFMNLSTMFSCIHPVVLSASPIRRGTANRAKLTNAKASAPSWARSSLFDRSGQWLQYIKVSQIQTSVMISRWSNRAAQKMRLLPTPWLRGNLLCIPAQKLPKSQFPTKRMK